MKSKNMPSVETQKRMHAFFMKTSAPRIYEKMMLEKKEQMEIKQEKEVGIIEKRYAKYKS